MDVDVHDQLKVNNTSMSDIYGVCQCLLDVDRHVEPSSHTYVGPDFGESAEIMNHCWA